MRVTIIIVAINIVLFIVQALFGNFTKLFALTPIIAMNGSYWQFITYMFLHGSISHIILNMFVLFVFGIVVEKSLGWRNYIFLYLISGIGSAMFHIVLTGHSHIPMLGASGAVFAVLTAYGFLYPKNWIVMFPGIPMPAFLAVVVFAALEFVFGVFGLEAGIANWGHFGGIVFGVIFMLYWRWKKKREKPKFLERNYSYEFFWE